MNGRISLSINLILLCFLSACATTPQPTAETWPAPVNSLTDSYNLDACFYNFTKVYEKRIHPVLYQAPGVSFVSKSWGLCNEKLACACYELAYNGSVEELIVWLQNRLKLTAPLEFETRLISDNHLELWFNGGVG